MEIRPYQEADETAVAALWREAFPNDPPHHNPALLIREKLAYQRELFFVALEGDDLLGTVMAGYDGHRGWLYKMAVSLRQRRRGVGRKLIRHAEAALAALGCTKVNLQVRATNSEVIAFYQQLGYSVEEHVSMGRRLPPP